MNRKVLLETFEQLCGTTEYETEDIRSFLQVKQYQELQDSTKFLIVGGRGSGKTRIFKTFTGEDGFRRVIGEKKPFGQPNYENTDILIGYSIDDFTMPNQTILKNLKDDNDTMAFWVGSIVIKLFNYFSKNNEKEILTIAEELFNTQELTLLKQKNALKTPSKWIPLYQQNPENWEIFLDEVDQFLLQKSKWLIIAYDQIDRISTAHDILYSYIRTLITYWFSVGTRWRRLKSKIFIRTDLRNSESLQFPDASKLGSRQIDLSWNRLSLYRLLVRRLSNAKTSEQTQEMLSYMSDIPGLVQENQSIGYLPTENEETLKVFIVKLIGRYMGSSPKKGDSYSWVPNHLQDANGDLAPRSFLKCYACAAQTMLRTESTKGSSSIALLTPSSIQGAVQEVSTDRVAELKEDFPWIENLKNVLEGGTLLMPLNDFKKRLKTLLNTKSEIKPPVSSVDELMNLLLSLGIILKGTDGRINMPEIYLHGFGLRRKGGLRRLKE